MTTTLAQEPVGTTAADISDAVPVERRLLAAMLGAGGGGVDALDTVATIVTAADFAHDAHAAVFGAALDLHAGGEPVTLDAVYLHLRRTGRAADLGNAGGWLADLFTDHGPAVGAYAEVSARKVRDLATRRRLKRAATALFREADAPGPVADVAARCEQLLFDAADPGTTAGDGPKPAREWVQSALDGIDDRAARGGELDGISTGLAGLDDLLRGMQPGQLIVVGARPGVGKTALGLRVGLAASGAGVPTLFVSAEMPEREIATRAISQRSGVGMRAIQAARFGPGDVDRIDAAARDLKAEPFWIDDTPGMTAARVASELRRAVRRRRVGLCVIDYLQLLTPDNGRENRTAQVGAMVRTIKNAARGCGVPVVLLCQLNRGLEGRDGGKPRLSDLRESGEIEASADAVVLLHVQPDQDANAPVWRVDAICAKNRQGPTGETTLDYIRPILRFDQSAK